MLFVVLVGFLDENSIVRRLGYYREETRLRGEIDRYRAEYEENTRRLNELAVDSGAIEKIAREKYLMKKPNEDIYVCGQTTKEKQVYPCNPVIVSLSTKIRRITENFLFFAYICTKAKINHTTFARYISDKNTLNMEE